jgi:galactonate dehydratase
MDNMKLELECHSVLDQFGHHKALLQKGDWLFVVISDGHYTGIGESSFSGDDARCIARIQELFKEFIEEMILSPDSIKEIESAWAHNQADFLTATAVSGIDQALYDLLGKREGVPVWQLMVPDPVHAIVPVYVTINRALSDRTVTDYLTVIEGARRQGFDAIKCAPFESVTVDGDQAAQSQEGRSILHAIRAAYPDTSLRIDFHQRFSADYFIQLLPEFDTCSPCWYEEPCEIGPAYQDIMKNTSIPIAAGELHHRAEDHFDLMDSGWVNVIMPDVKHVGGWASLLDICRGAAGYPGIEVSLHNPSGPISTMASLHAAVVSSTVTSMEIPFRLSTTAMPYQNLLDGSHFIIPSEPGWGISLDY